MANGGDVLQFTYGGREFPVSADADVAMQLSGYDNTTVAYGNGSENTTSKRRLGSLKGLVLGMDNARKDLEFLNNLQSTKRPYPVSITWVDGLTYAGQLKIDGDGLSRASASGQATIDLVGKTLEQI